MGIYKSYFSKNNTIQYGTSGFTLSYINTAKNPITELYYGNDLIYNNIYTRYLFNIDLTKLQEKVNDKTIIINENVTHTLKLYNTNYFNNQLLGKKTSDVKLRTSSFDLLLFYINEEWDEGVGYDYTDTQTLFPNDLTYSTQASNWYYRQTSNLWNESGVYSNSPSAITITTQHFDNGNENVEMNITAFINSILTGSTTGITGFGLAFPRYYETLTGLTDTHYVGFYTKYTQTFYEPLLETIYNDVIKDDRNKFCLSRNNRLFLYSFNKGIPTNLDSNPTCTINDNDGNIFSAYTSSQVHQLTKGVYYIDLVVPSVYPYNVEFTDTWSDIIISGSTKKDVEMNFVTYCEDDCYQIGSDDLNPQDYAISLYGIKQNEYIKRGDIRKVNILVKKPYFKDSNIIIDEIKYRIYVKQGETQLNIIDWSDTNRTTNSIYFTLDTNILIPQKYYIDIQFKSNLDIKTLEKIHTFFITNEISNNQ